MVGEVAGRAKVLVKERISEAGVELLRQHFDVDVRVDMTDSELTERINDYDALIIRSATKVTAGMLEGSCRLKIIGRAGTGVDNVDVKAATKKGIVVANAPESNSVAAAEHALALLMAQCRQIPQAYMSMKAGKWERSKFGGVELTGKTLGVIGLGRIGMLVAQRAKGLRMDVIAYDPYVSAERFRESGLEQAETLDDVYAKSDFITMHMPKTPETAGMVGDAAFAKMKDGVRIVNAARGGLVDEAALARALDSGKVTSAGLDVYTQEPIPPDFPLLHYDNVVLTPHLGASTEEAQDKAGTIIAEQVIAGLLNQFVSNAVNIPSVGPEALEAVGPFLPLAETLGKLIMAIADGPLEDFTIRCEGQLAEHDTRLITVAVVKALLEGRVEEPVNYVNAPSIAEERGLKIAEVKEKRSRDFTNLITVVSKDRRGDLTAAGTTIGPKHKPRLVKIYRHDIDLEPARHMAFFQYDDVPGMIGRVGTALGDKGINIAFMNVGRKKVEGRAVMGVALDDPIPQEVLDDIVKQPGFYEARAVEL
ncbi:MAG: phosphoglycerate dehydrogenase [Thermoleophilia bacterium]|nr:phosphoglycerate dehydrogenase [Thermoleophilia bacterium]